MLAAGTTASLVAALFLAPAAEAVTDTAVSFAGARAVALPAGSGRGTTTALGDLNGDGRTDLLATVKGSNTLAVSLGDGKGGFAAATSHTLDTGTFPTAVAVGDLNGDRKPDAVVAAGTTGRTTQHGVEKMGSVVELLGDGEGGFAPATSFFAPTLVNQSTDAMFPVDIAVADLNGDKKPDVLTSNANGDNVSVWLNDGTGGLGAASNYYVGGGLPSSYSTGQVRPLGLAVGDVDRDGKPDVVTVNSGSSDISLLRGDGKGKLGPATRFADSVFLGTGIAMDDLNGDGDPDVAVAHSDRAVTVFLGDGEGDFDAPVNHPVGGTALDGVAITDVNGDAKPDLVTNNGPDDQPSVLLGDGAGVFRLASPSYHTKAGGSGAYAVGDLNGDGRPDLVGGSTATGVAASVLLNTSKTGRTSQSMALRVAAAPGVLSMQVALPKVNFGTLTPGSGTEPAGLGNFRYTDTLSGKAPWSVTVAATDLVSGTNTIPSTNLRVDVSGHINGTGGWWTGTAQAGAGGRIPAGDDARPGTSLSPALTMATGDGGTRGVFTHDGSTAQWNIPSETVPGSYSGTLQYTITG